MRTSALVVLFLSACAVAAPVPQPNAREAAKLVEQLGSAEFAEREAAGRRLDELGVLALDDLRAACKSEDPEIAQRAIDLVRKIERRAASERALAPTVVELAVKDAPLDTVLAELSKRAGYEVVLNGPKANELAAKRITLATGKVPFWSAVLKVCDAAELQIGGVGGFVAPGSAPLRVTPAPDRAVVLEARGAKKRPASVHGAVLVEALPLPEPAPPGGAALVQFWPEPKLAWQAVAYLKVTKATDDAGDRALVPDLVSLAAPPPRFDKPGAPVIINDGTASTIGIDERFGPNVRQAIVKFKPGAAPATVAGELTGSASALVRAAPEPLATIALDPKKAVAVTGKADVEMDASTFTDATGKQFVDVRLAFPPTTVDPVRVSDELPDIKPAVTGGNRSVLGVRVTDADGAAFVLAPIRQRSDFNNGSGRIHARVTFELVVAKGGPTEPAKVVFWGTTARPVEIPFALKDVPLK